MKLKKKKGIEKILSSTQPNYSTTPCPNKANPIFG